MKEKQESFLDKAKGLNPEGKGLKELKDKYGEKKDEKQKKELKIQKQEKVGISFEKGIFNFSGMNDIAKFANTIASSELVPKQYRNKPSDITVCIAKGLEFGLNPFVSLEQIAVINGRAVMWGDALMALIQKSGELDWQDMKYEGTRKENDWKCIFSVKRKGREKPVIREFSWIQAKEAGLNTKDNWQKHPERMLMQRARSYALRDCFPDILGGLYSREEMIDSEYIDITPKKKKNLNFCDTNDEFMKNE